MKCQACGLDAALQREQTDRRTHGQVSNLPSLQTSEEDRAGHVLVPSVPQDSVADGPIAQARERLAEFVERSRHSGSSHMSAEVADLILLCQSEAQQELERLSAIVAEYEGVEGRCSAGHNKKFTYELNGSTGCVVCERADLRARAESFESLAAERQQEIETITAELKITDALLESRTSVLAAIPECPAHGQCVPHALEWIQTQLASLKAHQGELQENLGGHVSHGGRDDLKTTDRPQRPHDGEGK